MRTSLQKKILSLVLGLVVVSIALISAAVVVTTNSTVREQASQQLVVGQRILDELLLQHGTQLLDSATVLVDDFGFKRAVTSKDVATINSALENSGERIEADLMALMNLDGELITQVAKEHLVSPELLFSALVAQGSASEFVDILVIDGHVYKIVVLPVRAPLPVAYVIIGLEIDQALAEQLKSITTLDVSFVTLTEQGGVSNRLTTLAFVIDEAGLDFSQTEVEQSDSKGERFLGHRSVLKKTEDYVVITQLHASLDKAYEKFDALKLQILSIAGLVFVVSVFGAVVTSRNVTRPVARLVEATKRISGGDYRKKIVYAVKASAEIVELGQHFEQMQSQIAQREDLLARQAHTDMLTGLGNRLAVSGVISRLIEQGDTRFLVVRLNIGRFKEINDTFGYEEGDVALRLLAEALKKQVADDSTVARFGADDFAAVFIGKGAAELPMIYQNLEQTVRTFFSGEKVAIQSLFLGAAEHPVHGEDTESLLRRAEIALNKAKDHSEKFRIYELGADESHRREIQLVADLKEAIRADRLMVYYQPKFDVAKGRVTQVEALLRWIHDEYGFISPEEFVGLAEQSGQMPKLTEWMVNTVCAQRSLWLADGLDIDVAVNLSAYDLNDTLPGLLKTALEKNGLRPKNLILEVTESAFIDKPERAIAILAQLNEAGFRSSMDDYGTGYSSLSQLKKLPIQELKIDKSFVLNLDSDLNDQKIVRSTIELANALSLNTVAEGVETLEACKLLIDWGCNKLQGYFFTAPLNVEKFEEWMGSSAPQLSEAIRGLHG